MLGSSFITGWRFAWPSDSPPHLSVGTFLGSAWSPRKATEDKNGAPAHPHSSQALSSSVPAEPGDTPCLATPWISPLHGFLYIWFRLESAYSAIAIRRSRIQRQKSGGFPSLLRATLCIDVEIHFVRIVTSMRVCTDKRTGTTQM